MKHWRIHRTAIGFPDSRSHRGVKFTSQASLRFCVSQDVLLLSVRARADIPKARPAPATLDCAGTGAPSVATKPEVVAVS